MKNESLIDQLSRDKKLFEIQNFEFDKEGLSKEQINYIKRKILREQKAVDHLDEPYDDNHELGGESLLGMHAPYETGLSTLAWVGFKGNAKHDVRIRISNSIEINENLEGNTSIIGVRPVPYIISGKLSNKDRDAVFKWININKKAIINEWVGSPSPNIKFQPLPENEWLFEMTKLFPYQTGLPMPIYASNKDGVQHDVRIKVCAIHGNKMIMQNMSSVSVRPMPHVNYGNLSPKDKELVFKWVEKNTQQLVSYWNRLITPEEFKEQILPITDKKIINPIQPPTTT